MKGLSRELVEQGCFQRSSRCPYCMNVQQQRTTRRVLGKRHYTRRAPGLIGFGFAQTSVPAAREIGMEEAIRLVGIAVSNYSHPETCRKLG